MSLLEEVRTKSRLVAERAGWVEIDVEKVPAYAASLPPERLLVPEMDPVIHYLGHGADTVAYCLVLDAINFGSGYFPAIFGDRRSGYRTIAAALTGHFVRFGPLDAERLRAMSPGDCAGMFAVDPANPAAAELMARYAEALNDLGAFVSAGFNSDFSEVVRQAGNSAERLVGILAAMPYFRDVTTCDGLEVPFFKRAQLAAVDVSIALGAEGIAAFDDLDRLTICADNLVPHVLRHDGVLRYREELAARIDRGEALEAGSPEEVEIRACAVHAGELIVTELKRRGQPATAMLVDNLLWHRGQEPVYRSRPRHRTRTVFY